MLSLKFLKEFFLQAIANEDWLCLQKVEVESYGTYKDLNNWKFAWEVVFNQKMLGEYNAKFEI